MNPQLLIMFSYQLLYNISTDHMRFGEGLIIGLHNTSGATRSYFWRSLMFWRGLSFVQAESYF